MSIQRRFSCLPPEARLTDPRGAAPARPVRYGITALGRRILEQLDAAAAERASREPSGSPGPA